MENKMFCYQCEQAAGGKGCLVKGVCGKSPEVSALQDLVVYGLKGLASYFSPLKKAGIINRKADRFVLKALFSTVTNVNFDLKSLRSILVELNDFMSELKAAYKDAVGNKSIENIELKGAANFEFKDDADYLINYGRSVSKINKINVVNDDIISLQELLTYGLKGAAAYAYHAYILGKEAEDIYIFFQDALNFLNKTNPSIEDLLSYNLKCGEINLKVMELLDRANTEAYGHPEPTKVRVTPISGKAIVVSGHDLKDLEELLKQTEGRGVNVYTHGEMLPALAYPRLKKYKHLVGNYGGAWQDQKKEFKDFPGAILMTTNCIQEPAGYIDRIFTSGPVDWPFAVHVDNKDFTLVINAALRAKGFDNDADPKYITIGFGHNAVMNVVDSIVQAVKDGKIKRFFLIGGCDGAKSSRNYYTEFAQAVPKDSVILTLACGKYRFNKLEFGDIEGIPRLLDVGQCNDAYSAIKIALALSDAFGLSINDLPLSFVLSWYEQKAVVILLTLLYLGIKNIRLGPTLPAFITPNVLGVLVDKFNVMPITNVEKDLKAILA